MIKVNKFFVKNTETGAKAKCWYSHGKILSDDRDCITIYAKEYGYELRKVFGDNAGVKNETDSMTDYFDKDHIRIFDDNPIFADCLKFAR